MTVRSLIVSAALAALAVPASGTVAHAEEVIVLPALVPSGFPQKLAKRLSRESAARLSKMGLSVRHGADIDLAVRSAADCADPACLKERLGATGARLAARLVLERTEQGYNAKLEVTTLRLGSVLVSEQADCGGCDDGAVVELALSLIDGVQIPEHDPEPVAAAPPAEPEVEVPPEPEPAPPPPPEPATPPSRRSALLTWGPLVGGVVLLAASVPLWLLDGDPTCDGPSHTCPNVYDFFVPAAVMTGAGFVAIVMAGAFLLLDSSPEAPPAEGLSLRLAPGGLAGTF